MENGTAIANLCRIGLVSAVDAAKRRVRVQYDDTGMTSGWLYVLQHPGADVTVAPDGKHAHQITGGGQTETEPDHEHNGTKLAYWMPKLNDIAVVLYVPVDNRDGFILGVT